MKGSPGGDAAPRRASRLPLASGIPVRFVVVLLVVLVVASGAVVYVSRPPRPEPPPLLATVPLPHPVDRVPVGSGHFILTLPLGIIHNPANASVPGVSFESRISFSSGYHGISAVNYSWTNITGPSKFIQILYDPRDPSYPSGPEWFVYTPGGGCTDQCSQRIGWGWPYANSSWFPVDTLYVSYTVFLVTLAPPFKQFSWLEVWYRIGGVSSGGCASQGYCSVEMNVTDPRPSELRRAGDPRTLTMDASYPMEYDFNVEDFVNTTEVFHLALPRVSFDAGPFGLITSQLVSGFSWNPASQATFKVRGTADHNLTLQMYIDLRLGGMYPVLVG